MKKILIIKFILLIFLSNLSYGSEKLNYKITAPSLVTDASIVPLRVDFSPPIKSGASFKVLVNGLPLADVSISKGELSQFSFMTSMFSDPSVVSVECLNCVGQSVRSKVEKPIGISNSEKQFPVKDIKGYASEGDLRFKIFYDSSELVQQPALITVKGDFLQIAIKSSNLASANQFIGIKGNIPRGKYCLTYKNQFESTGCLGF